MDYVGMYMMFLSFGMEQKTNRFFSKFYKPNTPMNKIYIRVSKKQRCNQLFRFNLKI